MKKILLLLLAMLVLQPAFAQPKTEKTPFLVRPYLQIGNKPSPTSLQLLWHTADIEGKWAVEIQSAPKASWKKMEVPLLKKVAASNIPARRVYNATLSWLTPGSTFTYRLLKDKKIVFTSEAKAPKAAGQPYRFVAVGDIGAGTPNQKSAAMEAYLAKPDLVVITGDIVYERGLVTEYDTRFFPVYNATQADTAGVPMMHSIPFVAAPGNHDTDTRDLDKFPDALAYFLFWNQPLNGPAGNEGSATVPPLKASDANRQPFLTGAGSNYPGMGNFSFDYANAHWLVLDSNPYVDWTDKALLDWVAADLAASKDAAWHFVTFHHPGFSSSREHFEQQQMRLLSPLFEAGNVDVVFNGHVHNYQRSLPLRFVPDKKGTLLVGGKENKTIRGRVVNGRWTIDKTFDGKTDTTPEGIIYIVTGAGGQTLYNTEQNNDPDSWLRFTDKFISSDHSITVADMNGKMLTIRQVSASGKELDSFTISKP